MKDKQHTSLVLPALRGIMGNWVYYSSLMNLRELAEIVDFADDIHESKRLSDMIQRELKDKRARQIAHYLKTQPERLFSSLVIATYDGEPNWHPLSKIDDKADRRDLKDLSEETIETVGFLALRGDEKFFALDGQHRLAGCKKAVNEGIDQDPYDEVPVIFVAHRNDEKGLRRTRRLFSTLNRTAEPVLKGDIIALDEDDVMALTVRWLIDEERGLFGGERIAFVATNNMPVRNTNSLTTIGNLYDIMAIFFSTANTELRKTKRSLQTARPEDGELQLYYNLAKYIFEGMKAKFSELNEFFSSSDTERVVRKYRGQHGGSVLFRPVGLDIFSKIIARLTREMSLSEAMEMAAKLPRSLTAPPFVDLMWDVSNKTISNAHNVTVRETLMYMLGVSKYGTRDLIQRYRREIGDDSRELPEVVI